MRILIINQFGHAQDIECNFIPSIGDKIDMLYNPIPTVVGVLAFPSESRMKELKVEGNLDAIITVS